VTTTRPRRELTAAASRYTQRTIARRRQPDGAWQERAWHHYDRAPEVRFASRWVGSAMSGARLIAGRRSPDGAIEPAPDGHRAAELVASIAGGPDGQAALLGAFGPHLVVAGEGWIVIHDPGSGLEWRVLSVAEIKQQGGKLIAEIDGEEVPILPGQEDTLRESDTVAIRVWQPHPRRHLDADSPVRSSMSLLEELELLNAAVAAIARSRLTGRGVLLVPQGTRFPTAPGATSDAEDDLIEVFMQVAETAIREPESAAATVPIILEVPREMIGEIKRLTFESEFDEIAIRLREEAIRRFANGLEIPAEILTGLSEVNHWGVWQLSQEAIRLGIEPRLADVCHALTTQWLRPLLDTERLPDAGEWLVWYDTSPLRVRTNRSETALAVHDVGAISDAALRRETGFEDGDAPTPGSPNTARAPGGRMLPADETTREPDTLPASARPAPIPHRAAVLAAADGLVWSALNVAGMKLRRSSACPRDKRAWANTLSPAILHTKLPVDPEDVTKLRLLDDAWSRVGEISCRYLVDASCLGACLEDYCCGLLATGTRHDFNAMTQALQPCLAGARP
jgi:hypothetical protein